MHYVLVNQSADKSMRIPYHHAHSLDDVVHLSMIHSTFAELEVEEDLMDIDIVDMPEEETSEGDMHDETSIVQSSTSHHPHLVHDYVENSDKVDASSSVC